MANGIGSMDPYAISLQPFQRQKFMTNAIRSNRPWMIEPGCM